MHPSRWKKRYCYAVHGLTHEGFDAICPINSNLCCYVCPTPCHKKCRKEKSKEVMTCKERVTEVIYMTKILKGED
jgi:hypothetical protein